MSSTPAALAGETAVMLVSELIVKLSAGRLPNETSYAYVKPEPVIVTLVPPVVGPDAVARFVTLGAAVMPGTIYASW